MSSLSLLMGEQQMPAMYTGALQIILAVGLFVGLVNLLANQGNRIPLGIAIPKQLISQPSLLGLIAGLMTILSFTELPSLPLLVLASLFGALAWTGYQQSHINEDQLTTTEIAQLELTKTNSQESFIKIELGTGLLTFASPDRSGNLVEKMGPLRAAVTDALGFTIPSIQIKDNIKLPANTYRIYLRGGVVGEGILHKDRYMVVLGDDVEIDLEGVREREPVFGLQAIWVTKEVRDSIGELFVQAMDPVSVVMTHLANIVQKHAAELLTREAVSGLVDELQKTSPRLVARVIDKTVSFSRLHHILTSLLEEQVSVNDLSTIVETASDGRDLPIDECVEKIREMLRRQICANVSIARTGGQQVIQCVELPREVELAVSNKHITATEFSTALNHAAQPLIEDGLPVVVVSSQSCRRQIREKVACTTEDVVVLSRSEIVPEVELQIVGTVEPEEPLDSVMYISASDEDKHQTVAYAKSLMGSSPVISSTGRIERGIEEIRTLVGEVLEHESAGRLSPALAKANRHLTDHGVDPSLATSIVQSIKADMKNQDSDLKMLVREELLRRMPRVASPPLRDTSMPTTIALVGPTGVGKTTTIAKLATKFGLQQGRNIVFVTADTYRVAAVDQVRQYAELFDAELKIAGTCVEMTRAISSLNGEGVVLIDTAGRSAIDGDRIEETAKILQAARPTETHLVLSATTSITALKIATEKFAPTGYDRVIVTKLDEAVTKGEIVSTLCGLTVPISWFTDGQDVSSHIDLARPSALIDQLVEL
ncbi:MAG: FHIPEP family type III secretion protein [Planctomycetota bacterium]|nr:FHIPEP family type III secretion protein [Planctomycetota bacterium]